MAKKGDGGKSAPAQKPAPAPRPDPAPAAKPNPAPAAKPSPAPAAKPSQAPAARQDPAPVAKPNPAPAAKPKQAPSAKSDQANQPVKSASNPKTAANAVDRARQQILNRSKPAGSPAKASPAKIKAADQKANAAKDKVKSDNANSGKTSKNRLTGESKSSPPNNKNQPSSQYSKNNAEREKLQNRINQLKDKITGKDTALVDQLTQFNKDRKDWQSQNEETGDRYEDGWKDAQNDLQSRFDEQQRGFDENMRLLQEDNEAYRGETEGLLNEYQSQMDQMGVDFENSWREREAALRGEYQTANDGQDANGQDDGQFNARMNELANQIESVGARFDESQQGGIDDAYRQQLEETLANYQRQFEELLKSKSESDSSTAQANPGTASGSGIDEGQYQAFRDWQAQDAEYGLQSLRGGGRGKGSSPFSGSYSLASGTSAYQSGRAGRGSGSGSMISGSYGSRSSTSGNGTSLASGNGRPAADYYARRFGR
jgi:hypothetical protein